MLRLTVRTQTPREVVLAVDGRVAGDNVQLLKREGERCQQEAPRLVLDLEGVQSIDEAGLALLRTWSGSGLVLHGGPAYLRALLAAEGLNVS
jgi:anti-anti-sigma regulatory factor